MSAVPLVREAENARTDARALMAGLPAELLIWTSPAFPVGAFVFSHGLEKLVDGGRVRDRAGLQMLLVEHLHRGTLKNDFLLMAAAWRAAVAGDGPSFREAALLALALQPSRERHLESVTQGRSFMEAIAAAWAAPALSLHDREGEIAYPVAFALAAGAHGIALDALLLAHGLAFVSNLVSAAIRLSVIGQTDGQRVIAALLPDISAAVARSLTQSLDDLGGALFAADLATLQHETQYSRLFRS